MNEDRVFVIGLYVYYIFSYYRTDKIVSIIKKRVKQHFKLHASSWLSQCQTAYINQDKNT